MNYDTLNLYVYAMLADENGTLYSYKLKEPLVVAD
jgi:hypothetical protein